MVAEKQTMNLIQEINILDKNKNKENNNNHYFHTSYYVLAIVRYIKTLIKQKLLLSSFYTQEN